MLSLGQLLALTIFAQVTASPPAGPPSDSAGHLVPLVARLLDPALADGFDFPTGDRNGKGTGATAWVIADGTVLAADGQSVAIEHRFLDNGRVRFISSITTGLKEVPIKTGDRVTRRQKLGRIAKENIQITLRTDSGQAIESPSNFIRQHRRLLSPARSEHILIAIKQEYQLHCCQKGKITKTFPIALSQNPIGHKLTDGDNCTPEGEYRITQKALGPFDGEWSEYLGAAWLRLSYPNAADARAALSAGRITEKQATSIIAAQTANRLPPSNTPLGGGIGIHGWSTDWPDGHHNLTWGCLSLRKPNLLDLYKLTPKDTPIIIHP